MKTETYYRSDIDGLRAVAILSVIIFHLNNNWLTGGYTGVDIFFVISGFLITNHIASLQINNNFTFKNFYLRRIKRIIPALVVMIAIALGVGYAIFSQYYFEQLGMQSLSALLSFSNIFFFMQAGYFDTDSIFKPLLHTWSLGVEEQFYMFWPILLVFTLKYLKIKYWILVLIILSFFSFVGNLYINSNDAIFYLMPFRIFEFSLGGIVAYLLMYDKKSETIKRYNNFLSIVGLILILLPLFLLTKDTVFPSYNALPTVIGAAIIIYTEKGLANKFLSIKPMVVIGLISYSLYLYHWPMIVYVSYFNHTVLNYYNYFSIIFLTLLFSVLSYFFVEKPFRYTKKIYYLKILIGLMIFLIIVSLLINKKYIETNIKHDNLISIEEYNNAQSARYSLVSHSCSVESLSDKNRCNLSAKTQVLFMGNSHGLDGFNTFYNQLNENININLISSTSTPACEYKIINNEVISGNGKCNEEAKKISSDEFLNSIDIIVVNYFKFKEWGGHFSGMANFFRSKNQNLKIIVVGAYLGLRPNECFNLVNEYSNFNICRDKKLVTYTGLEDEQWLLSQDFTKNNFLYIDTISLMCGKDKKLEECKVHTVDGLIFYDGDHLSLNGARYLGTKIFEDYNQELAKIGLTQ